VQKSPYIHKFAENPTFWHNYFGHLEYHISGMLVQDLDLIVLAQHLFEEIPPVE
jgi:hypothetical protein